MTCKPVAASLFSVIIIKGTKLWQLQQAVCSQLIPAAQPLLFLVSDIPLSQMQINALEKELTLCPTDLPDLSKLTDISITYCPNMAHLPDVSIIWKNIREHLLQVNSTSMGTEFTPNFAITFMTDFEESAPNK